MATISTAPPLQLGPESNGILLTPEEFDEADFERGPRYELIHGVLIVSPSPLRGERDPNGELEYLLRKYQAEHPQGSALDATFYEETLTVGDNRRRPDRVIYAGLGRTPEPDEVPTIVVEFVSAGRRNFARDYEAKRREYHAIGVREYWVIDRFARTMTVFTPEPGEAARRIIAAGDVYSTPLLPGFELPLARLFDLADRWNRPTS